MPRKARLRPLKVTISILGFYCLKITCRYMATEDIASILEYIDQVTSFHQRNRWNTQYWSAIREVKYPTVKLGIVYFVSGS